MPLTYCVGRPPLRPAAGKGEFRCINGAVLLRLQLIAAALIVLLNRAELIDGTVAAHVNGELLQITVAAFWRKDELITVLFDVVLLPVAGLVTGNEHKRRIAGRVF